MGTDKKFLDVGTRIEGGPSWRLSGPEFSGLLTDAQRRTVSEWLLKLSALPEDHSDAIDG
jgi:hypothetical protein